MASARHFLSLTDVTTRELRDLLSLARDVKARPDDYRTRLAGQSLAMIFQKRSTRTRVSFEVGMFELGGHALFLGASDIQIGRGETIADTARVLARYCDLIMGRVFAHADLVEMAAHSPVPVINGLSDDLHPCQVLADLQTIEAHFGDLAGRKLAYVGDGNNMAHSLLIGCAKVGMHITIVAPEGYEPDERHVLQAQADGASHGVDVTVTSDPAAGVRGAHVVYTDVWASMGQEAEAQERLARFDGFQVDAAMMSLADPEAVFMHCLPAHRGEEVSAEVCDSPQSIIFDQAENRLHAQKALMMWLKGAV